MAQLSLSNQATAKNSIAPKIQDLQTLLDSRKELWAKAPRESREKWIKSGKDPIMTLAWTIYKYLHDNFFSDAEGD